MTAALQNAIANAETHLRACAVRLKEAHDVLGKESSAYINGTDLLALKQQLAHHALETERVLAELQEATKQALWYER